MSPRPRRPLDPLVGALLALGLLLVLLGLIPAPLPREPALLLGATTAALGLGLALGERRNRRLALDEVQELAEPRTLEAALQASSHRLREKEAQLQRVLEGSSDGTFEWDLVSGRVERSPAYARMLGLASEALPPTLEGFLASVHPEDAGRMRAAAHAVVGGGADAMSEEFRARGGSGSEWRWFHARARRGKGGPGTLTVSGTVSDITERRRAQEQVDHALATNLRLVAELQAALASVKTLTGLLPICMHCHRIRNDQGYWDRLESYLGRHTEAQFSHGLCDDCFQRELQEVEKVGVG